MKAILNNPYRTIGLPAGASTREQNLQIKRLRQYIQAEQTPEADYSFPILGKLNRTISDIENAESKLNLSSDKVDASLFWFYIGNNITDQPALDSLKDGDAQTANQIWFKLISQTEENNKKSWKSITQKNHSAFHNYAVLNMIWKEGNVSNAIITNLKFLESDYIDDFIAKTTDLTYKPTKKDLQLSFINQLYAEFKDRKTYLEKLIKIVQKTDFLAKQDFLNDFAKNFIEQIERLIDDCKTKRKANKTIGFNAGNVLYEQSIKFLEQIRSVFSTSNIKYSSIADKVANELLQCSIDYFNCYQEKGISKVETAMDLAKKAKEIAVGSLTKERANDSISTLQEMKYRELSEAIEILKFIKSAYQEACRQIDKQMEELVYRSFGDLRTLDLNYSLKEKVNEMKQNALNWDMVIKTIKEAIPIENISKIKNANSPNKLRELRELIEFLLEKSPYRIGQKLSYLKYWEVTKNTSTSTTPKYSSSNGNNDEDDSFKFSKNAWWIFGLIGFIIGCIMGGFGLGIFFGIVLVVIVGKFLNNND